MFAILENSPYDLASNCMGNCPVHSYTPRARVPVNIQMEERGADQPMRRYLIPVAVGLAIGWATWPFVAAVWKPNHPDDAGSTYWSRVRDGYWWRTRKWGRPGQP